MARRQKKDVDSQAFTEALDVIYKESERGAVVAGAALVEDHLDVILWAHFEHNDIPKVSIQKMFDFTAPLGTFSAKVKMAYAFGLITRETAEDCDRIRDLRNEAAHASKDFTLKTQRLKQKVKALRHSVQYDDPSDSEVANISHEKYLFGLCAGALSMDILRDFNKYTTKRYKAERALLEEQLRALRPKGGLLGIASL